MVCIILTLPVIATMYRLPTLYRELKAMDTVDTLPHGMHYSYTSRDRNHVSITNPLSLAEGHGHCRHSTSWYALF